MSSGNKHIRMGAAETGLAGVQDLGFYKHSKATGKLARHDHGSGMEICYLARGEQTFRTDAHDDRLVGGDIHIVRPHELHDSAGRPLEKGSLYWIVVEMTPKHAPLLNLHGAEARSLRMALVHCLRHHFHVGPDFQNGLERAIRLAHERPTPLWRAEACSLLTLFLLAVAAEGRRGLGAAPSPQILRSVRYVRDHQEDPLSVEELATAAGLSVSRFKTRFRSEMGVPPREFVLREKIRAAKVRLAETSDTILDVALSCGFSSSQYFATVFRRYENMTPTEFRRQVAP